jgi:hypothetical protein
VSDAEFGLLSHVTVFKYLGEISLMNVREFGLRSLHASNLYARSSDAAFCLLSLDKTFVLFCSSDAAFCLL